MPDAICHESAEMVGLFGSAGATNTVPSLTINRERTAIMAKQASSANARICEACGAEYPKKQGVSWPQFLRSRACSRSCATRLGHPSRKWPSLAERFWAKVDKAAGHGPWGDCWVWTGCLDSFGYGRINRRDMKGGAAHRTSYDINVGKIPDGMVVRHRCDNPSCVRPDHLLLGTDQDNTDDMVSRGRQNAGRGEGHGAAKLTADQARAIFFDVRTQSEIATDYGVSQSAVMMIKTKRNWRHLWEGE